MEEVHLYVDKKGTNMHKKFSPCKDCTAIVQPEVLICTTFTLY